jgi:hypothetical protein
VNDEKLKRLWEPSAKIEVLGGELSAARFKVFAVPIKEKWE